MSVIHRGWRCGLFGCLAAATLGSNAAFGQACPGNVNGDGTINAVDLAMVLAAWGPCSPGDCPADIDGDGVVEGKDLAFVLSAWGPCPMVPSWATLIEARPDPAVVTDASLRAGIAASGYAWRVKDTATQIEMLLVPPGTFIMGCTEPPLGVSCSSYELPVHQVTLTQPFYLGRFEVTQGQFAARMGYNPSHFQGHADSHQRPVENLDVYQMRQFVDDTGMRFPSEAEWEYACRAGTTTAFNNGLSDPATLSTVAWWVENSDSQSHAVGQKLPNRLGFHDMLGNIAEWIEGCPRYYTADHRVDPVDPPCPSESPLFFTSPRGGAWMVSWPQAQSSTRIQLTCCSVNAGRSSAIGFRVARNP